jgi:hypothetical protein
LCGSFDRAHSLVTGNAPINPGNKAKVEIQRSTLHTDLFHSYLPGERFEKWSPKKPLNPNGHSFGGLKFQINVRLLTLPIHLAVKCRNGFQPRPNFLPILTLKVFPRPAMIDHKYRDRHPQEN